MTYTEWKNVPIVLSVDLAAEVLDVHPNTIRNAIKGGALKAQKVGRQWRITKVDLMRYLGLEGGE